MEEALDLSFDRLLMMMTTSHSFSLAQHFLFSHMWSGYNLWHVFPHLTNGKIFRGGGRVTEHKMCVLIFPAHFV